MKNIGLIFGAAAFVIAALMVVPVWRSFQGGVTNQAGGCKELRKEELATLVAQLPLRLLPTRLPAADSARSLVKQRLDGLDPSRGWVDVSSAIEALSSTSLVLYGDQHDCPQVQSGAGALLSLLAERDGWSDGVLLLEALPRNTEFSEYTTEEVMSSIRRHWPWPVDGYVSVVSACKRAGWTIRGIGSSNPAQPLSNDLSDAERTPVEGFKSMAEREASFEETNRNAASEATALLASRKRGVAVIGLAHCIACERELALEPTVAAVVMPSVTEIERRLAGQEGYYCRWLRLTPSWWRMPAPDWRSLLEWSTRGSPLRRAEDTVEYGSIQGCCSVVGDMLEESGRDADLKRRPSETMVVGENGHLADCAIMLVRTDTAAESSGTETKVTSVTCQSWGFEPRIAIIGPNSSLRVRNLSGRDLSLVADRVWSLPAVRSGASVDVDLGELKEWNAMTVQDRTASSLMMLVARAPRGWSRVTVSSTADGVKPGCFRFGEVPPGRYRIRAWHSYFATTARSMYLDWGQTHLKETDVAVRSGERVYVDFGFSGFGGVAGAPRVRRE